MGQQHRKIVKRRRRTAYIKRQKELRKNSRPTASVPLAKKVSQPAEAVVVESAEVVAAAAEPAKATKAAKAPKAAAKSTEAKEKKAPAKKAPAKKAPAKKAAEKEDTPAPAAEA